MMSMRSMKTILACACAVLAVSCAEKNEIAKPAPETRTITLNATSETIASQDKTRTALDKDGLSVVWKKGDLIQLWYLKNDCLLYTSPSPRDLSTSRMPSSA